MPKTKSQISRILSIYEMLKLGCPVSKAELAAKYKVDERSIQRDIDALRDFLADRILAGEEHYDIVYDRSQKGFILKGYQSPLMSNGEILSASKILLESRAYSKEKISTILEKLVAGCVPEKNAKLVSDLISNEKFHYVELTHPLSDSDEQTIWDLGQAIRDRETLQIVYSRQNETLPSVEHIIEPVALMFSEYYFYLNAYVLDISESKQFTHKHQYPTIFRVDRIERYKRIGVHFHLPYAGRFQEGEYRKRVQFMYPGELLTVRFRYSGPNVGAVLDRLPTAIIKEYSENESILEAEVYGRGVLMWFLSQGSSIEILAPDTLRREFRDELNKMQKLYSGVK